MTHLIYGGILLVCLAGVLAVDRRFRLVLWSGAPGRAALVLAAGTVAFLAWDLVAIAQRFYVRGGPVTSGIELAPHLPVEELVFIVFLCLVTLVVHGLLRARLDRWRS